MSENESARYNELERMRQLTGVEILEENFSFYIELTLVEKVELEVFCIQLKVLQESIEEKLTKVNHLKGKYLDGKSTDVYAALDFLELLLTLKLEIIFNCWGRMFTGKYIHDVSTPEDCFKTIAMATSSYLTNTRIERGVKNATEQIFDILHKPDISMLENILTLWKGVGSYDIALNAKLYSFIMQVEERKIKSLVVKPTSVVINPFRKFITAVKEYLK